MEWKNLGPAFDFPFIIGIGTTASALDEDGVLDIDTTISLETTWHAMEETVSLGLVRSIGIRLLRCSFVFTIFRSLTINVKLSTFQTFYIGVLFQFRRVFSFMVSNCRRKLHICPSNNQLYKAL